MVVHTNSRDTNDFTRAQYAPQNPKQPPTNHRKWLFLIIILLVIEPRTYGLKVRLSYNS